MGWGDVLPKSPLLRAGCVVLFGVIVVGLMYQGRIKAQLQFPEPTLAKRQADIAGLRNQGGWIHGYDAGGVEQKFLPRQILTITDGPCVPLFWQVGHGSRSARTSTGHAQFDCLHRMQVEDKGSLRVILRYSYNTTMHDPASIRGVDIFGDTGRAALAQFPAP